MERMSDAPELPEEIALPDDSLTEDAATGDNTIATARLANPTARLVNPIWWQIRSLRHGAYFLQWRPLNNFWYRYNGTMRIERHSGGVTASGDLYRHNAFRFTGFPSFRLVPNPDPSPAAGIPIFRRNAYYSYLRVTEILEYFTFSNSFAMKFERWEFDSSTNSWTNRGVHSAQMVFKTAPANYPAGAVYLEGDLKSPSNVSLGTISMGWVSKYLRKATLEIDRVAQSEMPSDNGSGLDWADVFDAVDWDLNAFESDTNLTEPSGQGWSNAEMHAAMLARRDSADLDTEWRYHILCVRQLDATSRGIMYDAYAGDSNNVPREGAGISSHWVIPNTPQWGTVQGQRFGTADAPYFRTAVHELGHALGLYHNTADNGFMNTTGTIAASPGTFPSNIQWAFNPADAKRLRHMPDPWVRPGMIPFGNPYSSSPISPTDAVDLAGPLSLKVEPLMDAVPIGAPVRVKLILTNHTDTPIEVPDDISLKSEHLTGSVRDPGLTDRSFRTIVKCLEEHEHSVLKPKSSASADVTLLRGGDGALFATPGLHEIGMTLAWGIDGVEVAVSGSGSVMITPPQDDTHAAAAKVALSEPDLLLSLAIGGDHHDEANKALSVIMQSDVLAPHFAVIEAKRHGRRFGKRKANPTKALEVLGDSPVCSASEAEKIARIISDADGKALKSAPKSLASRLLSVAEDSRSVKKLAQALGG